MGLHVKKMEADGNCLFRAFADQICGDCEEHQQYRDHCCDLMLENLEEFELFYAEEEEEENETFEAYVHRMRHPGRWGSQLELMALCRRYGVNAIVHQSGRPAYEMEFAPREAKCIQLSYHDGEHYNSIRFAWDLAVGQPAQFLTLLMLRSSDAGEGAASGDAEEGEAVKQVRECLPPGHAACTAAVRAALARANDDVTLAAEYLLTEEVAGAGTQGQPSAAASAKESGAEQDLASAPLDTTGDAPKAADSAEANARSASSAAPPAATPAAPAVTATPPRKGKDAAGRKRRGARERDRASTGSGHAACDAGAAKHEAPDSEAHLSLLASQLLTV